MALPGTLIPASELAALLEDLADAPEPQPEPKAAPPSWRVLLWTVGAETRIGKREVLEAVGRPASWLYRHTGPASEDRIPHRRLDGELVFVVGEIREWLRGREELVEVGPTDAGRTGLRITL